VDGVVGVDGAVFEANVDTVGFKDIGGVLMAIGLALHHDVYDAAFTACDGCGQFSREDIDLLRFGFEA